MITNQNSMKRLPAVEKTISQINPKNDIRVRILGTVIDNTDNIIMIDDGSGKAQINFEEHIDYVKEGQVVRIVARILPMIDGFEYKGECVQVLDNFDIKLYKDTMKIIKRC
ncbi:MAG: hypothetical protein PHU12_04770 [Candidatus Aenigmarchaeota archaeon]|nr:hypothetical protein [Candidatus Aenigmarchaeota archaeon]